MEVLKREGCNERAGLALQTVKARELMKNMAADSIK